jgi:hypothetical protein
MVAVDHRVMDHRLLLGLRWFAAVLAGLCVVTLAVAGTARTTVLNRRYYQTVLDDEHAYDRLYDEVLVDPAAAKVTNDLLAQLPVPEDTVLSNLKIVLPPTTLRQLVDEQIGHALAYLRGDESKLSLTVDLRPVLANIDVLADIYLSDLVASLQKRSTPDFPAFRAQLDAALRDLAAGRRPANLPTIKLDAKDQRTAQDVLLKVVPAGSRAEVGPTVIAALRTGDIAAALAAVGPFVLRDKATGAALDLSTLVGDGTWEIVPNLESQDVDLGGLRTARSFTKQALGPIRILTVIVGLAAFAFLWLTGAAALHRRAWVAGGVLSVSGLVVLALMLIVRWRVDSVMQGGPSSWPPSLQSLVLDLQHRGADGLFWAGLIGAAIPLGIGLLLMGGGWLWRRLELGARVARKHQWAIVGAVGVIVLGTLIGGTLAPAAAGHNRTRCLGSVAMCSLRYDQAAFLATHNSMSTTASRFIGPLQDPDITNQLDEGARALLIDTHTWEQPSQIAAKLAADPDFPPDLRAQLPTLINRVNPPKPGLWLCHAVCRAGAIPLVVTLRSIGKWLDANPSEVVTLIIQNDITGEQTASAFASAGVDHLLYTPSSDPSATWPTLGDLVRSNRRLVAFAEVGSGPAPWYANFYQYGMETPFAASSPGALSCDPLRGGTGKRLFLLNNFVTTSGGSRLAAGEVNARQFVLDRAHRCQAERHSLINFIAVDYATIGDTLSAVNALNDERLRAR